MTIQNSFSNFNSKSAIHNPQSTILIIGPAWIGDMVMTQTLFKMLKQRQPDILIDVLAPAWSLPLLACMPEINQAIEVPFKHGELKLRERYRLAKQLQKKSYQQAIVIPNSFKSALIPFFAKIPLRTGFRGEMRWGLLNDVRNITEEELPFRIQRYATLTMPAGEIAAKENLPVPTLKISPSQRDNIIQKLQLKLDRPILAICPGAEYGPAKRWPVEHYATLAKQKKAEGWDLWILGSSKEKELATQIQNLSEQACLDLTGKTTLEEVIYLLSAVSAVVASDSGLLHVAAALQKPVIVFYGITPPDIAPPLSPKAKILYLNLPCSPCFERVCPLGHHRCMRDITPAMVLSALHELTDSGYSLHQ